MAKRSASRDSNEGGAPLAGRRVVITRAAEQSRSLVASLRELGAEAIVCPAIAIVPPDSYAALDAAIRDLLHYDWIVFASTNAVRVFAERFELAGKNADALREVRLAAVGSATAEELSARLRAPDFTPSTYRGDVVAAQIGNVRAQRILIPSADIALDTLAIGLQERGADVRVVVAYRTVPGTGISALVEVVRTHSADAILFASPSAVRYALQALNDAHISSASLAASTDRPAFICIGESTAAAAQELRLPVDAVAAKHSTAGLVAAVTEFFSSGRLNVAT